MGIFQQFPYSNFHEFNLDQIIKIMKEMQDEWKATKTEWASYKEFIDNYFENLDVSEEVLDAMRIFAADGTLTSVMDPSIAAATAEWLALHITQPTTPAIDTSLSVAGAAADAKAVGDRFNTVDYDLDEVYAEIANISGVALPVFIELGSINTNTGADSAIYDGRYLRTGFIGIEASTRYSVKLSNSNALSSMAIYAIYYDASKIFVSSGSVATANAGETKIQNITTPAGAKYVRFRFAGTDLTVADAEFSVTMYDHGGVAEYKGIINTAGLDLNDFTTPGVWQLNDYVNYAPANYPATDNGKIIVLSNNNPLTTVTTFQMVMTYTAGIFFRSSSINGQWWDWVRIADNLHSLYEYGNIVTAGLDLNSGDFIHPGIWALNDPTYVPKNCPTTGRCRIISFASHTNNTIYTYQMVIDADDYNIYERFSYTTNKWTEWKHRGAFHSDIAFKCVFTIASAFVNSYTITQDSGATGRVSRLYALYDAVSASGVSITKELLGQDASETFNIYNYKVSKNIGTKPVVLLIVGEHGNELNSAMLGYYAYKEIVTGVLQPYLNFVDFWVVPLMNPYGYENSLRNNANDVNLNRDFPAEWTYSTVAHNKTGDYSLSQPETNIIYNLLVNNKDKILFICNKHDTGSISTKINDSQPDKVAYVSSYLKTDTMVNNGVASFQNNQVRTTDAWIITDCDVNLANTDLIVSRNVKTPGSLDLFANSIGIHGSLLEVSGAAYYGTDNPAHYPAQHRDDMARLGLDFFVNYISQTIENNIEILYSDDVLDLVKYYTRVLSGGVYVDQELYWNGSTLEEI